MSEKITDFKRFAQITDTRWYPRYHLAAPSGWCNDPNGFCFHNGQYHCFYQYYPYGAEWGLMHWGHAVSDDLAYWKHLPIALKPDKPYDADGCYSGCAVEFDKKLYLMYTGNLKCESGHIQTQCLAKSDDGVHFTKSENNPIIRAEVSGEIHCGDFRDPKIWEHDGKFYAVIGSRTPDKNFGQVLLYESEDMEHWNFKSIAARSERNLGRMWECPNFAEIDGYDVLIFSPMELDTADEKFFNDRQAGVLIGKLDYETGKFEHGDFQTLDEGFDFYAPQVTKTPDGRTILIGWLDTWHVDMPESVDGWAGQMTVPRELHVRDGKIFSTPVKELENLRKWQEVSYENLFLTEPTALKDVEGDACEIVLNVDAKRSEKFAIAVRVGDDEQTCLIYDATTETFTLDCDESGESPKSVREFSVKPTDKVKLDIFIDRSSLEIFINDGAKVISSRIYPQRKSQKIVFMPLTDSLAIDSVSCHKLDFGLPHPHVKDTEVNLKNQFPFLE
ncbi:MAG: sucrose-6-phosphate hydrolase [Selenomonadaceae bacterium]|nr:sucrose-6-phosphate hydrolase [Selenomonadaceae bacterium]